MLRGILLSLCISVFVVSMIFTIASFSGNIQDNIITGNAIGASKLGNYSFACLFLSFVFGFFTLVSMRGHSSIVKANVKEEGAIKKTAKGIGKAVKFAWQGLLVPSVRAAYNLGMGVYDSANGLIDAGLTNEMVADRYRALESAHGVSRERFKTDRRGISGSIKNFLVRQAENRLDAGRYSELQNEAKLYQSHGINVSPEVLFGFRANQARQMALERERQDKAKRDAVLWGGDTNYSLG